VSSTVKKPATAVQKTKKSVHHPLSDLIPKSAPSIGEIFSPTTFFAVESGLSRNDPDISLSMIADAIEENPEKPLPSLMRERVCLVLRGNYRRKPGPKPTFSREIRYLLARVHYYGRLKELRAAKVRGLMGKTPRSGNALHRRVAGEAIEAHGLNITIERFLNSLSEQNAKRGARVKRRK